MGKIGYSSVTLTDLTETLPVTLVLETSLDQNIQTKVGNLYTPNFKEKELIITPSLFLGQEDLEIHKNEIFVVPSERQDGYIYYQIGDIENGEEIDYYYGSTAEGSEVWVDKQGKLHIKRNLTKNLTVEANITNFYLPVHDYRVPQVSEVTPLNILLLEAGSSEYSAIITSSGREYFDEGNTEAITLTALLYKGATPLESGVSYKWDIMTDKDTPDTEKDDGGFNSSDFISREQSIIVTRDKVHNTEIFICDMSLTDGSGLTFTANKILRDFSDEYSNNLLASSSTILNPKNLSVEITNQVRWQTEIINGEGADQNRFKYEWSILPKEGEQIELIGDNYSNKTIEIVAGQGKFPKEDFTILGKVTIDNKITSFSYINIIYRETIYTVELSPKTFFIPVDSTGKITAPFSKEFSFKLLDENKKPVPFEAGDDKISLNKENEDTTFISVVKGSNSFWEDFYLFNLDIEYINNNFLEKDDPLPYEFSYQYLGQDFQEEINIVKVFKGPQGIQGIQGTPGTQGFSGYTVDLSNEFHAFAGGEGQADADQSTDCLVSAYYGSEALIIKQINLGSNSGTIIYPRSASDSTINYNGKNLFISASTSTEKKIKLTIRTNQTTIESEKSLFLREIVPVSFHIKIIDQNGEELTFLKTFTYTINYNGKSYRLIPSANNIVYNEIEKTFTPNQITVKATARQTSGEAIEYNEGKILYSLDNKNWKIYSNAIKEFNGATSIYLRLYGKNATFSSTPTSDEITEAAKYLFDTETIPIITSAEGYQIGGENLLRWTKTLPVEHNKWQTRSTLISVEKDGEFSVLNYNITDNSSWSNFRSPTEAIQPEYIGRNMCLSCYVYSDNWNSLTGNVSFGLLTYKDFNASSRDAYKNIAYFNKNDKSKIRYEGNWENSRWIKIWMPFSFDNLNRTDYDTNGDGEVTETDTPNPSFPNEVYKFYNIGFYLQAKGSFKIKKPKLELGNVATEWSASPYDVTYVEIEGENLGDTSQGYYYKVTNQEGSKVFAGGLSAGTYTFSFLSSSWNGSSSVTKFLCKLFSKSSNSSSTTETPISDGEFSFNNNTTLMNQKTFTIKESDLGTDGTALLRIYANSSTGTLNSSAALTLKGAKLEKGFYATGYTLEGNYLENYLSALSKADLDQTDLINLYTSDGKIVTTVNNLQETINNLSGSFVTIDSLSGRIDAQTEKTYKLANALTELGTLQNAIKVVTDADSPYVQIQQIDSNNTGTTFSAIRITNNQLGFYSADPSKSDPVAYIDSSKLCINSAEFKNSFTIGGLEVSITESGVGFKWP